jgi:hypothetical protein
MVTVGKELSTHLDRETGYFQAAHGRYPQSGSNSSLHAGMSQLNTPIPEAITNTAASLSIYDPDAESSIERISSWALAEWEKHPDKSDYVPDDFGSESLNPFSIFTETTPERICSARDTAIWCARIIQDELYTPRSLNPFEAIVVEDATEPPF